MRRPTLLPIILDLDADSGCRDPVCREDDRPRQVDGRVEVGVCREDDRPRQATASERFRRAAASSRRAASLAAATATVHRNIRGCVFKILRSHSASLESGSHSRRANSVRPETPASSQSEFPNTGRKIFRDRRSRASNDRPHFVPTHCSGKFARP